MMPSLSYLERRNQLHRYFDRTAAEAWRRMMSDEPLGRIRATVRAGRSDMRAELLGRLPDDLSGCRLLDAGCGRGDVAFEAAARGAEVVAVDVAESLLDQGRRRLIDWQGSGSVRFLHDDMCDPALGRFDYVVAMDSLIHYAGPDMLGALAHLARRTERAILFTFAPKTPLLAMMHFTGRLFPRSDRAPAIEPVGEATLCRRAERDARLADWSARLGRRVSRGFYISQAMELVRR